MPKRFLISTLTSTLFGAVAASATPNLAPPLDVQMKTPASDCTSSRLPVYFPAGQSHLTPAAQRVLAAALAPQAGCEIVSVNVTPSDGQTLLSPDDTPLAQARVAEIEAHLGLIGAPLSDDAQILIQAGTHASSSVLAARQVTLDILRVSAPTTEAYHS